MIHVRPSEQKEMAMKHCETTQNGMLLAMDGDVLPKASVDHLAGCSDCQAFQESLTMVDAGNASLDEPSPAVDQLILTYARRQSKRTAISQLQFPKILQYAAAACLATLLSLAAWHVVHRDSSNGFGGQATRTVTSIDPNAWHNDDLTAALGDMVATADSADHVETDQVDTLFSDESTDAVAGTIEKQLADIQADLYVASLTFN